MRKLLLVLFTVLLALLVANAVQRALASDATRIRWLVEGMADGFEDGSARRAVAGLSSDWRDERSGADRERLRQGLIGLFFEGRDLGGGETRYRLELPPEELHIEVDPADGDRAHLTCRAIFRDRGEPGRTVWEVAIEAELERRTEDWKIVRTRHETLAGRRLGPR